MDYGSVHRPARLGNRRIQRFIELGFHVFGGRIHRSLAIYPREEINVLWKDINGKEITVSPRLRQEETWEEVESCSTSGLDTRRDLGRGRILFHQWS